ncbi:MAG: YpdA family putative bacillithiol disulfide reductase [Ignavibacteria bacterium]|nr:YpdA family putative bacillithiol disulfide reductase [Ignavibacteria bacterium]
MNTYDVIVIGAGPSGLSCAIEAKKQGLSCVVIDKGAVADAIRRFPVNLIFFSTPELLEIGGLPFTAGGFRPTRMECVRYYQTVARYFGLDVRRGEEVRRLRKGSEGFEVVTSKSSYSAPNVVVATGYFDNPAPFEVPGADLAKVIRCYDEPYAFEGRDVAVVGGKNSAVEVALDLFRNGAKVTLIHRGPTLSEGVKYWILPDIENRIRAGEIKGLFETRVREIRPESILVEGKHEIEIRNDFVFVMIGYRPDTTLMKESGVEIDQHTLGPIYKPETMETNVKGLYVAGSVAAGKYNNKIFIENGRVHGPMIVKEIKRVR